MLAHRSPLLPRAVVALAAVPGFAFVVQAARLSDFTVAPSALFWVMLGFLLASELFPVRVPWGDDMEDMTISPAFAFALVLASGLNPALLATAGALTFAGLVRRRVWWRVVLTVGHYSLALGIAAALLALAVEAPIAASPVPLDPASLPGVLAAGAAFFVLTSAVGAVSLAVARGLPSTAYLTRDFTYQAWAGGVLIALMPMAVVAGRETLAVAPLLAFPLLSVHRSTAVSLARAHEARHDDLTGLPNRAQFRQRVLEVTDAARQAGGEVAVLLLDLDGFKEVNDTLGHHTGDVLLRRIADRLRAVVTGDQLIARLGGDEFGVLVPMLDGRWQATSLANGLVSSLAEPIRLDALTLRVRVSIGISVFPDHGLDCDTLLQRADIAMYQAKAEHTGYELYTEGRDQSSRRRLALLSELPRAIERQELVVHFQPKVRMSDGRVTSMEALVRWNHPWLGLVSPGEFVPLAERSGAMRALTLAVVAQALSQWRHWVRMGMRIVVGVNLSAQNLHDDGLPADIAALLETYHVPAEYLELEITETMLMRDQDRAAVNIDRLAAMGVRVVIDDFGTGYSSLAYLQRLPVHGLKIDKSFVEGLGEPGSDPTIVRSTIDLARNLGLEVVAEGVETMEAFATLRDLGCHQVQGYLVSEPLSGAAIRRWLAAHVVSPSGARALPPAPWLVHAPDQPAGEGASTLASASRDATG